MKNAIYIGVNDPTDRYRELILEKANISVLTSRRIEPNVDSFLITLAKVLKEETPQHVVLEEEMPVNLMMATFSVEAYKLMGDKLIGKTVEIYGLDDGGELSDIVAMCDEEFENHLKEEVKLMLIAGTFEY